MLAVGLHLFVQSGAIRKIPFDLLVKGGAPVALPEQKGTHRTFDHLLIPTGENVKYPLVAGVGNVGGEQVIGVLSDHLVEKILLFLFVLVRAKWREPQ